MPRKSARLGDMRDSVINHVINIIYTLGYTGTKIVTSVPRSRRSIIVKPKPFLYPIKCRRRRRIVPKEESILK
jgi:hypothetical protein